MPASTRPTPALAPYTAFCWAWPGLGAPAHLSPMVWIGDRRMPGFAAKELKSLPGGRRVLFVWHASDQIWGDPKDSVPATAADIASRAAKTNERFQSPWLEHGSAERANWFSPWLDGLKQQGASIDFLVTDAEVGLSTWAIKGPQIRAIVADPRFAELAKNPIWPEITHITNATTWDDTAAWNDAMGSTIAGYFRKASFDPLRQRFPDCNASEYYDFVLPKSLADRAKDLNGWAQQMDEPLYGSVQSPPMYGQLRQLAISGRNDGTNPDFAKDPMATIAWEAGTMRALVLGSSHPIVPWFCPKSWAGDAAGGTPLHGTPYWAEMIDHAMLSGGCVSCLFWNPKAPPGDTAAMSEVLGDLAKQTNGSPSLQPLLTDPVPYSAQIIVSGARCVDGRAVYRVSVMPGITSATVQLPGETQGRTVTIPLGQVGAWIVVPPADH